MEIFLMAVVITLRDLALLYQLEPLL